MYCFGCAGNAFGLESKVESGQCSVCGQVCVAVRKSLINAFVHLFLTTLYILYLNFEFKNIFNAWAF